VVVLLLLLGVGGFFLFSGDDDVADDVEETTTTEEEETTTTEGEETTTTGENGGGEQEFVAIADDTGVLVVEVPVEWTDVDGAPIGGDVNRPNVQASTDVQAFRSGFDVPGMSFSRVGFVDPDAGLDLLGGFTDPSPTSFDQVCTPGERNDYSDPVFEGRIQFFEDCLGIGTLYVQVVANPIGSQDFSVEINFQLTVNDDPAIGDHILATFNVVG
jgi:serine protease Do